jgi:hypothetical protein
VSYPAAAYAVKLSVGRCIGLDELRRRVGLPGFPVGGYVAGAIFLAPVFFCLAAERMNEYWDAGLGGWATGRL